MTRVDPISGVHRQAGPRRVGLEHLIGDVSTRISGWAAIDASRMTLWAPAALALGIGLYFSLGREPAVWIAPIVLILSLVMVGRAPRRRLVWIALALAALGFANADFRTGLVDAPALSQETHFVDLSGRLISVEEGGKGRRLTIAPSDIEGIARSDLPAKVRIRWRGKEFSAAPGDHISIRARLSPPPPPVAPGTYDFARQLYFQRIGGVGFAVSAPAVLTGEVAERTIWHGLAARIEVVRFSLFRRITEAAPGDGGAIVAAVVTGKREAITSKAEAALRDSGLAHLLAISGLHMGLATGLIFFVVRLALAANERLALRYPIKKWAAAAALASGVIYLILSGGGWSARRAFIMAAIMFLAIIFDRRALSLRNVGIAAVIILLMTPEALLHPGFQMSFAAVTALVAAYEWASGRSDPHRSFSITARLKRYGIAIAATDTIAALATAPFALFHFHRVAIYSLPANMIAMPLMGFWIMPFAVLGLVLSPLGLDGWAWQLAARGVEVILDAGGYVSGLPGAIGFTADWPVISLILLALGGLWLCLQTAPWRLAGFIALPLVALINAFHPPPDVLIAPSGLNAGVRIRAPRAEAGFALLSTRRDRFAAMVWAENAGVDPNQKQSVRELENSMCDQLGCTVTIPARIAFSTLREGLSADCVHATLVIATYPVTSRAKQACKARLIDRRTIWDAGAHAIWVKPDGSFRIETASDRRGQRPWTDTD